jgi:phage gpG-like protein
MAGPVYTFQSFGFKHVADQFDGMARDGYSTKPAMEAVATYMFNAFDKTFTSEGRRGGGSWKQLTTKYRLWKESQPGAKRKILQFKGPLRKSMTKRRQRNQHLVITRDEVIIESTLDYAAKMQFGYSPRNVPARPFVKLTEADRRNINKIVKDHLMRQWKRGGRRGTVRR